MDDHRVRSPEDRPTAATRDDHHSPQWFSAATDFDIHGGQFISAQGGIHFHTSLGPSNSGLAGLKGTAVDGIVSPSTLDNQSETKSEPDLYCSQLWRRRRGFPLYTPEPSRTLGVDYTAHGVSIGDVGMVTEEGMWGFFFNIFLPADHPINGGGVPDNFCPMEPYTEFDLLRQDHFPGSYVASSSIHGSNVGLRMSGDYSFRCGAPAGALLYLPHGSQLVKLAKRRDHMRQYIAKNAPSWYQYLNHTQGRDMANGELYIISGCEKAFSGSMATFQQVAHIPEFPLTFRASQDNDYLSRFDTGTPAQTKSFPYPPPRQTPHSPNNTVFLHGYTVSLSTGLWGKLFPSVYLENITDAPPHNSHQRSSGQPGTSGFSYYFNVFTGSSGGPSGALSRNSDADLEISALQDGPKIIHPSRAINQAILQNMPEADIVLTHDDDWADILSDEDVKPKQLPMVSLVEDAFTSTPQRHEAPSALDMTLLDFAPAASLNHPQIRAEDIKLENGVAYMERRNILLLTPLHANPTAKEIIDDYTTSSIVEREKSPLGRPDTKMDKDLLWSRLPLPPRLPARSPWLSQTDAAGCLTCRIRGKRCDKQTPSQSPCPTCDRLGLQCLPRPEGEFPLKETPKVEEMRKRIAAFLSEQGPKALGQNSQKPQGPILRLDDMELEDHSA